MATPTHDVCVVGSGPGGGIATYALAKAGLKVALVEAGPRLRVGIDYGSHRWPYDSPNHHIGNLWRDRHEKGHFTPVGDRPGHGLIRALGGRSLCWAGHTLRFGPLDFQRWPISYDEVAPYYSRAEKFMGVYGYKDGLSNIPDGEFLKPVPMRCAEEHLRKGVRRLKAQGRQMDFIAQRKAMLTGPHWSKRSPCHFCGHCTGCAVDAKYTSANTPIPLAQETGNLTIFTESMMTRIIMDSSGHSVSGIEFTKADGKVETVQAKALVLSCSAVETARQLLLNKTREFPDGLANSSGQVGRNLTSHYGITVMGFFPDAVKRDYSNDDGTGYYHSLLTGLYWDKPNPNFEGTYQVQCGAGIRPHRMQVKNVPGYGASFKRKLRDRNIGNAGMNMQGSLLISPKKFVDLDSSQPDAFGLAKPRIHLHYEPSDVAMAQDMVDTCEEIIRAGGGEVISTPGKVDASKLVIDLNHWVGTVRMGTDPKTSVVDTSGRAHDVPNLFIGDASVFPHYPEKNPTLSNIALSWRMADHLAERFRNGEVG